MSFIDEVLAVGSTLFSRVAKSDMGKNIAKTIALGVILNQTQKSINKQNSKPDTANTTQPDRFVREQLSPDTKHAIPVVYGTAFVKGVITDAWLTADKTTMWYCVTICEKTGNTNLGAGAASVLSFEEIYLNESLITFQSDGITVASITDANGNTSTDPAGLIKIYCFNNGSTSPVVPTGYVNGGLSSAYSLMPNWTVNHTMSGLVFALVKVEYSKEKNVTSLGEIEFKIKNTMTQPGDCLYDYMTNTRYGAGIPSAEIYLS